MFRGAYGLRSIPTCVGKILKPRLIISQYAVHPHVCGENDCHIEFSQAAYGPSPRVWGKFFSVAFHSRSVRSIPTCVGKI